LLAQVEKGLTLLHLAAQENHAGILEILWVWAKETQQNPNELKKNFY
jgi:hypothetical protein